ncbi:Protein Mrg3-like protein [Abortiporus biennis]
MSFRNIIFSTVPKRRTSSLLNATRHHLIAPSTSYCRRNASKLSAVTQSNARISTVFTALILLGVASTGYGVYEFYSTFTMWPEEIRGDLRAGVKAKHQDDLFLSERYLQRAYETSLTLPLDKLSTEPYLKLSGIASVYGEVLEKNGKAQQAYEVYSNILQLLKDNLKELSGRERVRAAAISYKLGEMAEEYQQPAEEEEKWLVWSVEEMLRIVRDNKLGLLTSPSIFTPSWSTSQGEKQRQQEQSKDETVDLSELDLPRWITTMDLVGPLQALGSFYGRTGKQEYAVPLYLSALNVLMPPDSKHVSVEAKCQGANIMNSLADCLVQHSPTPQRREQAESWIKKAIAILSETKSTIPINDIDSQKECDVVLASSYFNIASLREMAGDLEGAKKWYIESKKHSASIGMKEGVMESEVALRRIIRIEKYGKGAVETSK